MREFPMAQSLHLAAGLVATQSLGAMKMTAQAPRSIFDNQYFATLGQSSRCSLNSKTWRNRTEKRSEALSLIVGSQFVNFGLPELRRQINVTSKQPQRSVVSAALPVGPASVEVAANLFTLATAIVIPFYTVMILAPKWEWTDKLMRSEIPYFILAAGYIYLFALSWTPETLSLMFSSKYWLPELPGITRMFSSTLTVASAWLHLLAVDLFAGRQVFLDGTKHNVETRHSLVLCLMACPVGVFSHLVTKNVTLFIRRKKQLKAVKQIPPF